MSQYIIKLTDTEKKQDYYLMWSTVVDAPLTYGLSLEQFKQWYGEEHGTQGLHELEERMERVDRTGCSGYPPFDKVDDLIKLNRAGKNSTRLTKQEILENYCLKNQ